MKKRILLLVGVFAVFIKISEAQIQKKDWILGGDMGYNYNNSNNSSFTTSSNINLSPHVGYAVGNNSVVGLSFSFSYATQKQTGSPSYNSKNTSLNFYSYLFYKKYIPIKDRFGLYLMPYGGAGVHSYKTYDSAGTVTSDENPWTLTLAVTPGIYYQATPGILVYADFGGIFYTYSKSAPGVEASNFGIGFLNSFNVGVEFILGKKK